MICRISSGSRFPWIAVAVAVAGILALAIAIAELWSGIGDSQISLAGWLAMGCGVVATLGLGIGLMSLVFISSRGGYDEAGRGGR